MNKPLKEHQARTENKRHKYFGKMSKWKDNNNKLQSEAKIKKTNIKYLFRYFVVYFYGMIYGVSRPIQGLGGVIYGITITEPQG